MLSVCEKLLNHPGFTLMGGLTNNGETALHWAASNGRAEVCALLLNRRVDPDVLDVEGMVALEGARINGHAAVCALLSDGKVSPYDHTSRAERKITSSTPPSWL